MADPATTPAAPPYDLELLLVEIPQATSPEEQFCARPRDQFVDQALAVSRAPRHASFSGDEPVTVDLVIEGSKLKVGEDGSVSDGEGRMALDDFLVDLWSVDGFAAFDTVRAQLRSDSLVSMVDAIRTMLSAEVVEFLTTFEANLLSTLVSELEKANALAGEVRRRYLEDPDPPASPTDLQRLRDEIAVLVGVSQALCEHERFYEEAQARLQQTGAIAMSLVLPLWLVHFVPQPPPEHIRETFGPVLGPVLEEWFAVPIEDYRTGRDALLRAAAAYLAGARQRHPIIIHLWRQFGTVPSEEQLAAAVAELCDRVAASSAEALEDIAKHDGFRLLLQQVTVVREVPHEDVEGSGDVHTGSVAEHLGLDAASDPLATLAGAMAARDSPLARLSLSGLNAALNTVSVWDLDALRETTLAELGEQASPVQRAALALLDREQLMKTLTGALADFAGQTALKLVLAPTGLSLAAELLLDVVDGVYAYAEYHDKELLAVSELFAAAPDARRILSRDPSLVQLLLAAIPILGDGAAIARMPRLVRALGRLQLVAVLATAGARPRGGAREDRDRAGRRRPEGAAVSGGVSSRVIAKGLVKAADGIKDPALKKSLAQGIGRAVERALPSHVGGPGGVSSMASVGSRRWTRDKPAAVLAIAAKRYSKTFSKQLDRLRRRLHARFPTIAEATDLTELMTWLRKNRGRTVTRSELDDLVRKAASRAAEDTVIFDERFLGKVDETIAAMLDLGADRARMERLGLAKIDPEPYIFTKVAAPRKRGFPEARFQYVDIVVMFAAQAPDGRIRYVTKIKCQVKLMNAEQLTSHLDFTGRYRVGQLLRDRERGRLGSWHFSDIRIPRDALIDDARLTKLVTFASREFTDLELESLAADRIKPSHFVHAVAYEDFYRWADELVAAAGIKVGK